MVIIPKQSEISAGDYVIVTKMEEIKISNG